MSGALDNPVGCMARLVTRLRRFRAADEGNATIEFAVLFPLMLLVLFASVELGVITVRQIMLERAMDTTVRDIRLGTGGNMQHDDIRDTICARSGFIDDCETSLRLEMVQLDPFEWTGVGAEPDCVNSVEEVDAVTTFRNGGSNDLMFLRACMSFDPLFPHWGLADSMQKDGDGRIRLYAASAFVQEPK
ncbi:TadE/TadG family type IV pilus assembly protein [Tritonibacter horizontis]|uniref:TadE-like protein n=1 Tax=Tritonibacter horizontis TaxID=1768241 RepID=A0A132BV44_9RHOB|nr:TadE/TadG family type IV pilus assembly protein [Tritonibacter horizontis]KUP92066.1 TadE-like protein [Tritonibacter horizontis]